MAENPPAFPQAHGIHQKAERQGMTLRDWFAGQALCGLLASEVHSVLDEPSAALMAYQQADAMLIERERQS